jgi:predicted nucleic acid-binding protein
MKILVDTNILLDVAQVRAEFFADSEKVLRWCEANPGSGMVAWHSISNLNYVLRKNPQQAREYIEDLVEFLEVVQTGTPQVKHALVLLMTDFEDALQVSAAVAGGVDVIVTRNARHFRGSPVPVQTPAEFLASLP